MAEHSAETNDDGAAQPASRNWKKLLILGGAGGSVVLLVVVVLVWLLSGSDTPPKKPKPKKTPVTSEQKPAAEVASLESEKQKLLEEQIELLRKENAELKQPKAAPDYDKGGVVSGEKNCQLSGDPAKRKEELRACLGVPSEAERQQGMALNAGEGAAAPAPKVIHWGYWGEGAPEHWGSLSKDFAKCETGRQQSPINIVGPIDKGAPKLDFDYRPSALKLLNNGHSIQVNYTPGSFLKIDGQPYDLLQFHFHTPSEEQIRGRMADMDIHFVHKNKAGQLAVVAVLLNVGVEHPALKAIWNWFPANEGPEQVINEVTINAANILPVDRRYYAFDGSLTTPPCSEGVRWFVLKQPVSLSREQFKRFLSFYHFNARPAQPLNGRKIREN